MTTDTNQSAAEADEWTFLERQLEAFIAGVEAPSFRSPEFARTLHAIGMAATSTSTYRAARLGSVALAAMLERLMCAARAERTAALLIDKARGA